ncbi:MAG: hypothetical protein INR70_15120 [Parafilimonas terrae]|nr:hypothetical protein [Parafilimonas terrae]
MSEPGAHDAHRPGPDQREDPADDGAAPDKHPVDPTSTRLGYEVADARAGTLGTVMAVAVAIIFGSLAVLFIIVGGFLRTDARHAPLTQQQAAAIAPPGPPLQDDPFRDIAAMRAREGERLDGFAYLGQDQTHARIPLARAEAIVTGKPLDPSP